MIPTWFFVLCEITVISTGLVSGLFLTFSDFLMRSLKLSSTSAGIEVMQVINREIYKSTNMLLLWGNLPLTVGLAGYAYNNNMGPASIFIMAGAILYFVGVFVVTFTTNVPMNRRLDTFEHASAEASTYWEIYVPRWVYWNYIRAFATGATATCFLIACVLMASI